MNEEKVTETQKENNNAKDYSKNNFRRQHNEEVVQSISKDGRYQIVKVTKTYIVPIKYFETVYRNHFGDEMAKSFEKEQ